MKRKNNWTLLVTTAMCLLPMLLTAFLYARLPEQIAIHFTLDGTPNGFASKAFAGFILPLILAIGNLFFQITLDNDPKKNNGQPLRSLSKWLFPFMSVLIVPMILFISLGYKISVQTFVPIFLSLLFIIIGNYLPKCKQNYTIGIKLPWTLSNEENWNRTHRLAGWIWTIGGIIILVSGIANFMVEVIGGIVLACMIGIPTIYSFALFKSGKLD
ncbi:SdpI family protein [uncultured Sphaerochaeta sp.]|uniref:SdpI family protein n=1 Tax=uncultured Sphaerochaeta sp. TaxID=886478 RepID=UPI002A0A1AC5|nr:SdpI family protein [uncultured Sphaerochaeta sp.]